MKTMSFNVLTGRNDENDWPYRKTFVSDIIKKYEPDTIGLQEAHIGWMKYLESALDGYCYAGVGRDDGKIGGEFTPVFYNSKNVELLKQDTFWLSETPEKPSKGWDAPKWNRICTYAVLKDKKTNKKFVHMNTHLDNDGIEARKKGAELIVKKSDELFPDLPIILTGDFNDNPESEAYKTIISGRFEDARISSGSSDNTKTYHGFDLINEDEKQLIDFIFVKNSAKAVSYKCITDEIEGRRPSDHYPVISEIII